MINIITTNFSNKSDNSDIQYDQKIFENEKLDLIIYQKEKKEYDITFVIQGKIKSKELLIKNIINLSQYGYIQLAIWELSDDLDLNQKKVISYIKQKSLNNSQNLYFQVHSTLYGIKHVNTKYTIKLRADEYYEDFNPFILKLYENLDKIITNNVFFRKTKSYIYHISDHIIGGLTINMLKMFENCKNVLHLKQKYDKRIKIIVPEQWLTISYLLQFYEEKELFEISNIEIKKIMQKHFDIIPLENFKNFIVSYNKKNINGISDLKKHKNVIDIRSIDEI